MESVRATRLPGIFNVARVPVASPGFSLTTQVGSIIVFPTQKVSYKKLALEVAKPGA
jgi:hypothetical protein